MATILPLQCSKCGTRFLSPAFAVGAGASITLENCDMNCPNCGFMVTMPNITLKGTVEGLVELLQNTANPLYEAQNLFKTLQSVKTESELEKLGKVDSLKWAKNWIPNSPEKIAAYLVIISTIIHLWTKEPSLDIDYNIFINNYQESIQTIIEYNE